MKLSKGIHIEILPESEGKEGRKVSAVTAITLRSCPSSRLRDTNIQGVPIYYLTKQIDLINTLYEPGADITYAIRFISCPNPISLSGGRLDVCIFCKVMGASIEEARARAEDQSEQLLIQLCSSLTDYIWNIVGEADRFQELWQPFNWDKADVLEVRRREELVALDAVRTTRNLGFSATHQGSSSKNSNPVYYVHPFLPHPGQLERLLRMMLLHNDPIVYTAILTAVRFTQEEEKALLGEISRSEGFQPDPSPNLHRIQQQRASMVCQGLMDQLLRLSDSPFQISVSLASSHLISKTLAEAAGVAVSASVGENPTSVYSDPSFIQMGGYDITIPSNTEEKKIARANAAHLEQTPWGRSTATAGLEKLRFLVDGHEAAYAFRFPEDSGDGLPGIEVHAQRMRPIPPELVPNPRKKDTRDSDLYLGINTYLGVPQEVFLPGKDRLTHMYIVGQTGTGKTTLLKTMILSDIHAGRGCALIDPHGDFFNELLGLIPPERIEDVVLLDPSDVEYPVGMNLLNANNAEERHFVVREMQAITKRLMEDQYGYKSVEFMGPLFNQHLQMNMLLAMSDPDNPGTLFEFFQIFQSREYWKRWIPLKVEDAALRTWVTNVLPNYDYTSVKSGEISVGDYVGSKFADFFFDHRLRNIFSQQTSTIDLSDVMNKGKILLINLAKGLLGEANSRFMGLILMAKIQAEAMKRAKLPASKRQPFFLYVDEFQSLATENFTILLSEARKFGLGLVLANQFISQIKDPRIIQAVFGNVGTLLSFRLGLEDAQLMAPQFLPYFDHIGLTNLPNWRFAAKATVQGRGLPPFTLQTVLPPVQPDAEIAAQVREASRRKYNKPRAQVEEMIAKSLKT